MHTSFPPRPFRWILATALLIISAALASAQGSFQLLTPTNNMLLASPPDAITWTYTGADTYTVTLIHVSTNRAVGVPASFANLTPAADADKLTCVNNTCTFAPGVLSLDDGRYAWTVEGDFDGQMIEAANAPLFFTLIEDSDIELLVNGGFETAGSSAALPANWTLTNADNDRRITFTAQAHTGAGSMRFIGTANRVTLLAQSVINNPRYVALGGLKAGDQIKVSGYVRTALASAGVVRVVAVYTDPTAGLNANGRDIIDLPIPATGANTYSQIAGLLTLDGDIKNLRVVLRFTSPTGKLFVDDMSLVRVRDSAVTLTDGLLPMPAAPAGE